MFLKEKYPDRKDFQKKLTVDRGLSTQFYKDGDDLVEARKQGTDLSFADRKRKLVVLQDSSREVIKPPGKFWPQKAYRQEFPWPISKDPRR